MRFLNIHTPSCGYGAFLRGLHEARTRRRARAVRAAFDQEPVVARRGRCARHPAGSERYDDIVDAITAWHPECRASKIFGMPCVKRAGRVVFGFSPHRDGVQAHRPGPHARALAVPGAHLFDPSGRGEAFRQWVVVPPERADEWEPLAAEAVEQDHGIAPT